MFRLLSSAPLRTLVALALLLASLAGLAGLSAHAEEQHNPPKHYGPYQAVVLKIIDGDTVKVRMWLLPGLSQVINVRLAKVDTPELRGGTPETKARARKARDFVARLTPVGTHVVLRQVHLGRNAGRVIGEIWNGGLSLGEALLAAGLAEKW